MTNVLILMSDEHNARVSSVYGHPIVETPNMDRLATEGTVFDSAYCPSPLCAPSRSSFMAGLPCHLIDTYNNCNVVTSPHPSYGSVLRDQGVYTVYAGKADVYTDAESLGFSELMSPGNRKAPGDIAALVDPAAICPDAIRRADGYGVRDDPFAHDTKVVDGAVAWLTAQASHLDRPWTLTVNIGAPHFPHYVTQELWDRYKEGGDLPSLGSDQASANHPYAQDLRWYFQTDRFSDDQIRGLRRGYLGCVAYVDVQLGRLLEALDAIGQRNDTVVVYTSDHGDMLGKFGMWWKCSLYEDSARVPLIVSGPGFRHGVRTWTPVSLLDLQASIFHATSTGRPQEWWGEPLQWMGQRDAERVVFAEYHGHGTRSGSFMIRKGPWKLLYHLAAPNQLFNLELDPDELVDRHDTDQAIAERMAQDLRQRCDPEAEGARIETFRDRQRERIATLVAL